MRLAELVAALSLGVDLGFGQPMEHVLRQCLIALRLADRIGLDEEQRSVVYYTALLVNVGCHSDAHEQAKWFGDDIALKSGKYDYEFRSLRAAVASLRLVGSGNPPLRRFRVGLELALSGRREFDGMIAQHAALARALAEQLGLSGAVQDAVGSAYEQWDGRGWPGKLAGEDVPIASRLAQLAEFVEVAHRIGGVGAATALADKRAGTQFDPSLAATLHADADAVLGGLDSTRTWEAVIGAEPALGVHLTGDGFDRALVAIADFVDLKSRTPSGTRVPLRNSLARPAGSSVSGLGRWRCCTGPALSTTSGVSACRTPSGTSTGRSAAASGSASGCTRT